MLISLKNYWDSDAVKSLLAECMWPDDQRVNGELAGITGISCAAAHEVEIRHLAVQKSWRGRTLGSNMIAEIAGWEQVELIRADTDQDAVGFYSKAGFEIHSLGEKYPGLSGLSVYCAPGEQRIYQKAVIESRLLFVFPAKTDT